LTIALRILAVVGLANPHGTIYVSQLRALATDGRQREHPVDPTPELQDDTRIDRVRLSTRILRISALAVACC
jgi:hypothetical protein